MGPVPRFPRKIEDGIDAYLASQTSLQADDDPLPPTPVLAGAYNEKRRRAREPAQRVLKSAL